MSSDDEPRWSTGVSYTGPGTVNISDSQIFADNPVRVEGASSLVVNRSLLHSGPLRLSDAQVEVLMDALRQAEPGKEEFALKATAVGRWLAQQSFTGWASLAAALVGLMK